MKKTTLILVTLAAMIAAFSCQKEGGTDTRDSGPEGALSGEFSVSANKKVRFSKGNLYVSITKEGSPISWHFSPTQYSCLEQGGANKTIGIAEGDLDLFGWPTQKSNYGISASNNNADYAGDFIDLGTMIDNKGTWRTLSIDEWKYLLGSSYIRAGKSKKPAWVCNKPGQVIAPDDFSGTIETSYDEASWAIAEKEGLVFLPQAGCRYGSSVSEISVYMSSTVDENDEIKYQVMSGEPKVIQKAMGTSVRLVTDVK